MLSGTHPASITRPNLKGRRKLTWTHAGMHLIFPWITLRHEQPIRVQWHHVTLCESISQVTVHRSDTWPCCCSPSSPPSPDVNMAASAEVTEVAGGQPLYISRWADCYRPTTTNKTPSCVLVSHWCVSIGFIKFQSWVFCGACCRGYHHKKTPFSQGDIVVFPAIFWPQTVF